MITIDGLILFYLFIFFCHNWTETYPWINLTNPDILFCHHTTAAAVCFVLSLVSLVCHWCWDSYRQLCKNLSSSVVRKKKTKKKPQNKLQSPAATVCITLSPVSVWCQCRHHSFREMIRYHQRCFVVVVRWYKLRQKVRDYRRWSLYNSNFSSSAKVDLVLSFVLLLKKNKNKTRFYYRT